MTYKAILQKWGDYTNCPLFGAVDPLELRE
ncbi:hypothetical protein [Caudoviricetes sp.]|nr:hypothetical protein [Caudoviricetes sp.]